MTHRFDAFTKSFAARLSRRTALQATGLAAGPAVRGTYPANEYPRVPKLSTPRIAPRLCPPYRGLRNDSAIAPDSSVPALAGLPAYRVAAWLERSRQGRVPSTSLPNRGTRVAGKLSTDTGRNAIGVAGLRGVSHTPGSTP